MFRQLLFYLMALNRHYENVKSNECSRRPKSQPGGLRNPQIIVNKVASPGDADGRAATVERRGRGRSLVYLTVQIAATLRFGARDKVTAQIVISMTLACDLHGGAREITRPDTGSDR